MSEIDWEGVVKRFHGLGLWHATTYLKTVRTIKDPCAVAQDVVQDAWVSLWRQGKFSKGLLIAAVHGLAFNAARASRPVNVARDGEPPRTRKFFNRHTGETTIIEVGSRITDVFPVQIFAATLDEVTFQEDVAGPGCGDE